MYRLMSYVDVENGSSTVTWNRRTAVLGEGFLIASTQPGSKYDSRFEGMLIQRVEEEEEEEEEEVEEEEEEEEEEEGIQHRSSACSQHPPKRFIENKHSNSDKRMTYRAPSGRMLEQTRGGGGGRYSMSVECLC